MSDETAIYRISSNEHQGAYLKFWLKGGISIQRRALLNEGGAYKVFFLQTVAKFSYGKNLHYPCKCGEVT